MNPSAEYIANFASITFYVLGSLCGLVMAWASIRRQPPIEVDMAKIKEEVRNDLDAKLNLFEGRIDDRFAGVSRKIDDRLGTLKADLDLSIARSVSAGESRVARIETRLDHMDEARVEDTKNILEKIGALVAGKVDKK